MTVIQIYNNLADLVYFGIFDHLWPLYWSRQGKILFFIFSKSVGHDSSNDMWHVDFQANSIFTTWLTTWLYSCSNDVTIKKRYYFIVILVFSTNIKQYIPISPTCSILVFFDHLWPLYWSRSGQNIVASHIFRISESRRF